MIASFRHKGLEVFYRTGNVSGIQPVHTKRLRLILSLLGAATDVSAMNAPGLKIHQLKGDRKGTWAVTVQGNWRVTFKFTDGNAEVIDYEDYH